MAIASASVKCLGAVFTHEHSKLAEKADIQHQAHDSRAIVILEIVILEFFEGFHRCFVCLRRRRATV